MTTSLGSVFHWPAFLLVKNLFLIFQSELSLMQLHSSSLCPISHHRTEGMSTSLSNASLEEVVDCHEVTAQPSFLQAEQAKWPQLLLVCLTLEAFSPPWSPCSRHILIVWCPSYSEVPKTAHSVWGGTFSVVQCRGDKDHPLCSVEGGLRSASYAVLDTPQDTVFPFGCQGALLAHIQFSKNPDPQASFCRAALQPLVSQFAHVTRITPSQGENLGLAYIKFHVIGDCWVFLSIHISLWGLSIVEGVHSSSWFIIISKLTWCTFNSASR